MTRLQVTPVEFYESVYWAEDTPGLSGRSAYASPRGVADVEAYTLRLGTDYERLRDAMLVRESELGQPLFEEVVAVGLGAAEVGTFTEHGNYTNYRLRVDAEGAKQLRFDFAKLVLPEGAEAYFYNDERDFVVGPITSDRYTGPEFVTDIVAGSGVTFDVHLPEGSLKEFEMELDAVYYGVVNMVPFSDGYGTSEPCNVNVTCNEGTGWEEQRRATVLILRSQARGWCSGTAVENECRDNRPFIATASHCIGTGSSSAGRLVYRFGYESQTCPHPGGPSPSSQWVSFSGSALRARWNRSDYALVELNQDFRSIEMAIALAGWDRSGTVPASTTTLHHASADVMKISSDASSPVATTATTSSGTVDVWRAVYNDDVGDFGYLERGSSGGGLYSPTQRLVGVVSSGPTDQDCESEEISANYGLFSDAWTGDNTDATSLRPWLSPNLNLTTMNTRRAPWLSGPDVLCSSNGTVAFRLLDVPAGSTVTWQVDNSGLITGASSGAGTVANLRARSNRRGTLTLTYTVAGATETSSPDCPANLTFVKTITVGVPVATFTTPSCYAPGSYVALQARNTNGTSTGFRWTFPSCSNPNNSLQNPDPSCWNNPSGDQASIRPYVGTGRQSGSVSLFETNACGTGSINRVVYYCSSNPGGPLPFPGGPNIPIVLPAITATPSLAFDEVVLSSKPSKDGMTVDITVTDVLGRIVAHPGLVALPYRLDVSAYPTGIYHVIATVDGRPTTTRINVQR